MKFKFLELIFLFETFRHVVSQPIISSRIFPGAHIEPFEQIIVYDSSFPILYTVDFGEKHEFPNFQDKNQTSSCPWINHTFCQIPKKNSEWPTRIAKYASEEHSSYNSAPKNLIQYSNCDNDVTRRCQIADSIQQLYQASKILLERASMEDSKEIKKKRALDFIGDFMKFCCGTATQSDLRGVAYDNKYLADHVNSISQLLHSDHQDLLLMSKKTDEVVMQIRENLITSENQLKTLARQLFASTQNEEKILNYILLNQFLSGFLSYANSYQDNINSAKQDCAHKMLPRTLVSYAALKADLEALGNKVKANGYELAIPVQDLQSYYQHPFTSCTFYETKLLISVRIPLRRKDIHYRLHRFVPVPLIWEDQLCKISPQEFIIVNSSREIIITQENKDCDLKKGYCMVPRYSAEEEKSQTCARKIFAGSPLNELKGPCGFHCQNKSNEVIIKQVSPSEFFIANVLTNTYMKCNSSNKTEISTGKIGVLKLNIPCNCALIYNERELIKEQYPCDARFPKQPILSHQIPHTWLNLSYLHFGISEMNAFPLTSKVDEILNKQWSLNFPKLRITEKIPENVFEKVEIDNSWLKDSYSDFIKSYILHFWMLFITFFQLYLYYKLQIVKASSTGVKEIVTLRQVN